MMVVMNCEILCDGEVIYDKIGVNLLSIQYAYQDGLVCNLVMKDNTVIITDVRLSEIDGLFKDNNIPYITVSIETGASPKSTVMNSNHIEAVYQGSERVLTNIKCTACLLQTKEDGRSVVDKVMNSYRNAESEEGFEEESK